MSDGEFDSYYKQGEYVAVNLPGHKQIIKGKIINVISKNKSEYYLIEFDNKTLALVPRTDIALRILL